MQFIHEGNLLWLGEELKLRVSKKKLSLRWRWRTKLSLGRKMNPYDFMYRGDWVVKPRVILVSNVQLWIRTGRNSYFEGWYAKKYSSNGLKVIIFVTHKPELIFYRINIRQIWMEVLEFQIWPGAESLFCAQSAFD